MSWRIRKKEDKIPRGRLTPKYDGSADLFTIKFHHSGKFVGLGNRMKLRYTKGKVDFVDYVDGDKVSFIELGHMVREIGHNPSVVDLYMSCVTGDSCDGLLHVSGDVDVLDLSGFAVLDNQVCIFIDHLRKGPKGIACYLKGSGPVGDKVVENVDGNDDVEVGTDNNFEQIVVEVGADVEKSVGEEDNGNDFAELGKSNEKEVELGSDIGKRVQEEVVVEDYDELNDEEMGDDSVNSEIVKELVQELGGDLDVNEVGQVQDRRVNKEVEVDNYIEYSDRESEGEVDMGSDSEHSDYYEDSDGNYDLDDESYEKYVDHELEWTEMNGSKKGKKIEPEQVVEDEEEDDEDPVPHKVMKYKGFHVFDPRTDMKKVKLMRCLCFTSREILKEAIKKHAIQYGRDIEFPMNKTMKIQAKCCSEDCPWLVYASRTKKDHTFVIKTYGGKHTCRRKQKVSQATSTWLAKKYGYLVKLSDNLNVGALVQLFRQKTGLTFSESQMYRFRRLALNKGSEAEQYGQIYRLAEEIFRSNVGSTVKIKSKNVGGKCVFERLYIGWKALRDGMLTCRRMLFLDGCHFRNQYGGILLTATGIDANNGLYPFAYAIVEKETKESWSWFLDIVCVDLGITKDDSNMWTVMSDKQKGLIEALRTMMPNCEQRHCVYHLYNNFKVKHKGLTLKELVWRAAKATRVVDFKRIMSEMQNSDPEAFAWFSDKPSEEWSKAYFSTLNKSDVILNNLSESLNALLLTPRKKSVLDFLDSVRLLFMKRIAIKRQEMLQHEGLLCPRIDQLLQHNSLLAMGFHAAFNGLNEFHVEGCTKDSWVVNVDEKTCTCRRWQLNGIPCAHAISCLWELGLKPEEMVDECYRKETYLKTYGFYMRPIVGEDEWPEYKGQRQPLNPPIIGTQAGRPKKYYRRLGVGEKKPKKPIKIGNKISKHGTEMHCSICKEVGHNKQGCKAFHAHKEKMEKKSKGKKSVKETQNETDEQEAATDEHQRTLDDHELGQETQPQLRRGSRLRKRKVLDMDRPLERPLIIKEPSEVTTKVVPQPVLENNGKAKVVEAPKKPPKANKRKGFTGQHSKSQGQVPKKQFVPPRSTNEPVVEQAPTVPAPIPTPTVPTPIESPTVPAPTQAPTVPNPTVATRVSARLITRRNHDVSFSTKAYDKYMKKRITKRAEEEPLFQ